MPGHMVLTIWDVEHGACSTLWHQLNGYMGRLAMIDSGHADDWRPSTYIRNTLGRSEVDYLFITNADQDHFSDLDGLWENGIRVSTLIRNNRVSAAQLREIKENEGRLTNDAERFLDIHARYNSPVTYPFDEHMGGITFTSYFHPYPDFTDTNNLSLAVFISYGGFKILFPGDLEEAAWLALLDRPAFCAELPTTNILVASHHGRRNGYCTELFRHWTPQAVVMSDKAVMHGTQETVPLYRNVTGNDGVIVATTGNRRHVLTTRRDGHIRFIVDDQGAFTIETEYAG